MTKIKRQYFQKERFEGLQPGEAWTIDTLGGVKAVKFTGINQNGLYVFKSYNNYPNSFTRYLAQHELHTKLFRLKAE